MGIQDTIKDAVANAVGITEKAIIKVIDIDSANNEELKLFSSPINKENNKNFLNSAYISKLEEKTSVIDKLREMAGETENFFATGKKFTVQFNPSTLKLRASGGGRTEVRNFATSNKEENSKDVSVAYSYEALPFSIIMDVDLVFNKVDPNDAFLELAPSLATFKGAAKSVRNLIGKNASYSIQNEIEGLIATTRCFKSCLLSFNWGKLCYSGVLQHLSADYTVFNPKGEPVAGSVHLSMILIDKEINERNSGKWYKAYQDAFNADNNNSNNYAQKLGNSSFLNFTF